MIQKEMLSKSHFKDMLSELEMSAQETEERNFIVMTGARGMENFHLQLQKLNTIDRVKFLNEKGLLSDTQQERLLAMINSPYEADYTMAKTIVNNIS